LTLAKYQPKNKMIAHLFHKSFVMVAFSCA
jgi:hypothetical protein